jgi:hypothetical protein
MSLVPAFILAVLLTLVFNLIYVVYTRRSRALLAWDQLRQPVKRRVSLIDRLQEDWQSRVEGSAHWARVWKLKSIESELSSNRDSRVSFENSLNEALDALKAEVDASKQPDSPEWKELTDVWQRIDAEILEAAVNYNRRVIVYNEVIQAFPGKMVASLLGYKPLADLVL